MSTKRSRRQTMTVAEMRRTLRAAFAEGCEEVEMVPTDGGLKAVARRASTEQKQDQGKTKKKGEGWKW